MDTWSGGRVKAKIVTNKMMGLRLAYFFSSGLFTWNLLTDSQSPKSGLETEAHSPGGRFAWVRDLVNVCLWVWECWMREAVDVGKISFPHRGWKNEGAETRSANARWDWDQKLSLICRAHASPADLQGRLCIPQNNSVICLWLLQQTEGVALKTQSKYRISHLRMKGNAKSRYSRLFAKQSLLLPQTKLCIISGV